MKSNHQTCNCSAAWIWQSRSNCLYLFVLKTTGEIYGQTTNRTFGICLQVTMKEGTNVSGLVESKTQLWIAGGKLMRKQKCSTTGTEFESPVKGPELRYIKRRCGTFRHNII